MISPYTTFDNSSFNEVRPFWFFSIIAAIFFAVSLWLGYPLVEIWLDTGQVPRFPTAI